jgi:hypothetical protein
MNTDFTEYVSSQITLEKIHAFKWLDPPVVPISESFSKIENMEKK